MAKLGIDIDGVLYDWEGYLREQAPYLHLWGMPHELTDEQEDALFQPSPDWNYLPELIGKENWDWVWANQDKIRAYLGPEDYGRENWEALQNLGVRNETYLITSRPKDCWWQTYHWLTQYGEESPRNLAGVLHADDKVKTAIGLELDVVVDDRPSQLTRYADWAAEHHKRVWVYGIRRAWNETLHQDPRIIWKNDVAALRQEEGRWE